MAMNLDLDLVDALPYYDVSVPPELKAVVDDLISEELKRSDKKPGDYLKELGPAPGAAFERHALLRSEMDRVRRKEPMQQLDSTRYLLLEPESLLRHDPAEWKKSLDNAQAQLEHQSTRISNLELMLKLGDKNWRAQCMLSAASLASFEAELGRVKQIIQSINMDRKLQQTAAGSELRKAEQEYYTLLCKNSEIESAADQLEATIIDLKTKAQ